MAAFIYKLVEKVNNPREFELIQTSSYERAAKIQHKIDSAEFANMMWIYENNQTVK